MLSEQVSVILFFLRNLFQVDLQTEQKRELTGFITRRLVDDLILAQRDSTVLMALEAETKKTPTLMEKLKSNYNLEIEATYLKYQKLIEGVDIPQTLSPDYGPCVLADAIAKAFHLEDEFSRDFLRLLVATIEIPFLDNLFRDVECRLVNAIERPQFPIIASALGRSLPEVERGLEPDSPLMASGLMVFSAGSQYREASAQLKKMVYNRSKTLISPKTSILGEPIPATLTATDYDHMAKYFNLAANLLNNALDQKTKGVNVIFYGPPGTGKTEMAKTVAAKIKANLYSISDENPLNYNHNRVADYLAAARLVQDDSRTVLMVDEAEEFFGRDHDKSRFANRLFFNRLLENNPTPIVWVTNHIESLDQALIRRFSYAIQFDLPPAPVRERIWRRELAKHDFPLSEKETMDLAIQYELAPSYTNSALRSAKLLNDKEAIKDTLDSFELAIAQGFVAPKDDQTSANYLLELANADEDLTALTNNILSYGGLDFSLCLYGAPGTGKTEYLKYLAERLGLKILKVRASDLLNCFVGETEKTIAKVFRIAEREKKFLIFDEADSLIQDRRTATHNWEVSHVNEMLTWMERHPYPFACATNLMERLDQASLRRFSLKIKYDYLTAEQTRLAFQKFFQKFTKDDLNEKEALALSALKRLTPGDFVVVAKKAGLLGLTHAPALIQALKNEEAAKGAKTAQIGFYN
ncbi:MAG: ATP-binding protein [Deltaproteobacteria bacterium]|jgi:SpoVK/Ycf46/Vps4 family AAA+-type ATPase|nr:ATP-binding protein [Deltaproteobacteria bacterium]